MKVYLELVRGKDGRILNVVQIGGQTLSRLVVDGVETGWVQVVGGIQVAEFDDSEIRVIDVVDEPKKKKKSRSAVR